MGTSNCSQSMFMIFPQVLMLCAGMLVLGVAFGVSFTRLCCRKVRLDNAHSNLITLQKELARDEHKLDTDERMRKMHCACSEEREKMCICYRRLGASHRDKMEEICFEDDGIVKL